eukprot:CAMPEP_0114565080 /NCGR_PEP_ID=MMETSP0114-20121206/14104_1 /TAXON_ID=31324 /ORGANISM="Goniomonas sp, Strain m" /LENGTH=547 /DNA_ID=CAMNT_0001751273 /DNA_START=59 /DNA_END=1702 /DNA_ORIENTATION=+
MASMLLRDHHPCENETCPVANETDGNTTNFVIIHEVVNTTIKAGIDSLAHELEKFQRLAELCITCNVGLGPESAVFLWSTTLMFLISAIFFLFLSTRQKSVARGYYFVLFFLHLEEHLTYLVMSLSHGRLYEPRIKLNLDVSGGKQTVVPSILWVPMNPPVFYARYLAWLISIPAQVWLICRLIHAPKDEMLLAMCLSFGCVAALNSATLAPREFAVPWVLWFIGVIFWVGFTTVQHKIFTPFAEAQGRVTALMYRKFKYFLGLFPGLYLVVWFLAEGSRTISVDAEIITYAMLDFFGNLVFSLGFHMLRPDTETRNKSRPRGFKRRAAHAYHLKAMSAAHRGPFAPDPVPRLGSGSLGTHPRPPIIAHASPYAAPIAPPQSPPHLESMKRELAATSGSEADVSDAGSHSSQPQGGGGQRDKGESRGNGGETGAGAGSARPGVRWAVRREADQSSHDEIELQVLGRNGHGADRYSASKTVSDDAGHHRNGLRTLESRVPQRDGGVVKDGESAQTRGSRVKRSLYTEAGKADRSTGVVDDTRARRGPG